MLDHVPLLPVEQTIPSGATYNALARLLKFLDTDTPDQLQINLNAAGGLRLSVAPTLSSSPASESYDGPFALTVSGGSLKVNGGYINRNGEFLYCSGASLELHAGMVCVNTILSSGGSWTTPTISYCSASQWAYPLGMVSYSDTGELVATSYRVPVAIFIATAVCPLAKKATS
jgi:hypothetical protein